jgi:hypothetical protein
MNPFHPRKTPLDTIGLKHGTDKASNKHDYLNRYAAYFDCVYPDKILEIGIEGGASIRTWEEAFRRATIVGIDHNPKSAAIKFDRAATLCGDAGSEATWDQVRAGFGPDIDIIIDDGSHTGYGMIQTFQLAWPLVRSGGIYCIEDLHAAYDPAHNRDDCSSLSHDLKGSRWPAVHFFTRLVSVMNQHGDGQTGNPAASPCDIGFIHFSRSLIIIGKR